MTVDLPGQHVLERTSVTLDRQVCLCSCSARSDIHATSSVVGEVLLLIMLGTMLARGPADHLVPICK